MDPPPRASTSAATPPPNPAAIAERARNSLPANSIRPTTRVPFFSSAAQPEIVRANQKDYYYLSQLTERFEDVSRSLLGTRWLQKWGKELNQGSRLAYFGLTTLLGSQTLGEEYCDIMQYAVKSRKPPSARRRAALLSLHILLPYALAKVYSTARRSLILRNESLVQTQLETDAIDSLFASSFPPPPPQQKNMLNRLLDYFAEMGEDLPSFEAMTEDYLRSVHLAIFYLAGRYYNLSKRFVGIRFISTQSRRSAASPSAASNPAPSSYEVLGVLMIVQLLVRTLLTLYRRRAAQHAAAISSTESDEAKPLIESEKPKKKRFLVDGRELSSLVFDPDDPEQASAYPDEEVGEGARDRRCTLCLGTRRDPTATECGHVFCWECVVGWAREKPECPLCRQSIHLSKLLPVYNL